MTTVPELRGHLRKASVVLSSLGLRLSAKWNLEMLCGLIEGHDELSLPALPAACLAPLTPTPLPAEDEDAYALAKLHLEGREFARAARHLDSHFAPGGVDSIDPAKFPPRAFFLRCYASFMVRAGVPTTKLLSHC
jgi:hypothetical protein